MSLSTILTMVLIQGAVALFVFRIYYKIMTMPDDEQE